MAQVDPQRGMADADFAQERTEAQPLRIGKGADPEGSGGFPAQASGFGGDLVGRIQDRLGATEEDQPFGRGFHASRKTFEEGDAEFLLERSDLGAHRRLAGAQDLRRPGEVAFARDRREGPQLVELHAPKIGSESVRSEMPKGGSILAIGKRGWMGAIFFP